MREKIKKIIEGDSFLNLLRERLSGIEAYLAGGYIRDLALSINKKADEELILRDRDIVLFNCNTEKTVRNLADSIGAAFVELDPENKIYRIVSGEDYADIAQGLNNNLEDDIKRRDFTINSIFYDLKNVDFIDISGGFEDIKTGIIRTTDLKNLEDDPLRMFRAFRFMSKTGFQIDSEILSFIKQNANKLDTVAKERIQQEILKMFEGNFLVETLLKMFDIGFLEEAFPFVREIKKIPPNTHHHLDLVHHSIETVRNIRINKPLLKLAAFYHDIGKPKCWTIEPDSGRHRFIGHDEIGGKLVSQELSMLKFSKKQIEYVSKLVKNHIYPSALAHSASTETGGVTNKAMARFVRKIYPDIEDLVELARADRLSARGEAVSDDMVNENLKNLQNLLDYFFNVKDKMQALPKILDGKEIMEILKITPGPKLGEVIEALKEAQIEGIIQSREDAVKFIKDLKI